MMIDLGTKRLTIGIDAGGTSTRATVLAEPSECLGYGASASGNPTSAGVERARDSVLDAVGQALERAGRRIDEVDVIVTAMAGHGARGEDAWLRDALVERGFRGDLSFDSDLLALYYSGTAAADGYAIVSGTGAAVIRVENSQLAATSDGLGWLLGDRGSGFWIGHHVALAAVEHLDGRGPETTLTDAVLRAYDVQPSDPRGYGRAWELEGVIREMYLQRPVELARLAPLATQAVGDPVADAILREAGELLARTFRAVHRGPGPLVIGGGVLSQPGAVADTFAERAGEIEPGAELVRVGDGVVGVSLLALRRAGIEVGEADHPALVDAVSAARAE